MDALSKQLKKTKEASFNLGLMDVELRNQVLLDLAALLRTSTAKIVEENAKDLALMSTHDPKFDRLVLNEARVNAIAEDLEAVAALPYENAQILEEKTVPNGLRLQKVTVPLGVVAIIYESRPNVTIDTFSLCFKTGNACVLKGGKEAAHSNELLVALIHQVLQAHQIDTACVFLMPFDRQALNTLLKANQLVDVCIPRGSQALIDFVREHARIPYIETGAGIVHVYFDVSGDLEKGRLIINNAKTRRVSVCNALDTLVIHKSRLDDLSHLVHDLISNKVALYADRDSYQALSALYPKNLLHAASSEDFGREFLDYKMAIKTVASVEEAVRHIMKHTSAHSEAIVAEDEAAINYFLAHIDAAALYVNASTAFTDGGQFGMGAEIGISTQKLHARGPMALDALSSYKWIVYGQGHTRP